MKKKIQVRQKVRGLLTPVNCKSNDRVIALEVSDESGKVYYIRKNHLWSRLLKHCWEFVTLEGDITLTSRRAVLNVYSVALTDDPCSAIEIDDDSMDEINELLKNYEKNLPGNDWAA